MTNSRQAINKPDNVFDANLDGSNNLQTFFENDNKVNIATGFFRSFELYSDLNKLVLPQIEKTLKKGNSEIRIWSAGCSDGREPYSIAMSVQKWIDKQKLTKLRNFSIRASDISRKQIQVGKQRQYKLVQKDRSKIIGYDEFYYWKNPDEIIINNNIAKKVHFYFEDIIRPLFSISFDLIICTNVLVYYEKEFKKQVLHALLKRLKPQGHIFLESLGNKEMTGMGLSKLNGCRHYFIKN